MKWLLIITLFGDSGAIQVRYGHPTEDICNRAGENQMAFYEREDAKAEFECVPASPFVVDK